MFDLPLWSARLSGTPNAVTTTFTYEPTYSRVASVVDPLGHTSTFAYDSLGNLVTATDALNHSTSGTYTPAGQLASVIDALGHTTTFAYQGADLAAVTNPLGRTMSRFADAIGRVSAVSDPLGNRATFSFATASIARSRAPMRWVNQKPINSVSPGGGPSARVAETQPIAVGVIAGRCCVAQGICSLGQAIERIE